MRCNPAQAPSSPILSMGALPPPPIMAPLPTDFRLADTLPGT